MREFGFFSVLRPRPPAPHKFSNGRPLSYNSFSELNSLIDQLLHNWSRRVHIFTSSFVVTYHRLIEEGYFPPKAEWAQYHKSLRGPHESKCLVFFGRLVIRKRKYFIQLI